MNNNESSKADGQGEGEKPSPKPKVCRKRKRKVKHLVTRILRSKGLNEGKLSELTLLAKELGEVRAYIWRKYGGIAGIKANAYDTRKTLLEEKRFPNIQGKLWKATVFSVLSDISAYREAAKEEIKASIFRRTKDEKEQHRLFSLLAKREWTKDGFLRRKMRKAYRHGRTKVCNQIVLDNCSYTWKPGWLFVMGRESGKRIAIPLASNVKIEGTLRLIMDERGVAVHHTTEASPMRECGSKKIGVDKGYTEVFVDSDGEHHGMGLGEILSAESDFLKMKYQARNKIAAVAEASSPAKRERILRNNLGRKKLDRRKELHTAHVKDKVCKAIHSVVDKANVIVSEDLTKTFKGSNKRSRDQKRRLSAWVKGMIATFLTIISHRRCSAVVTVNASYTSQECSHCKCMGTRNGDVFHCTSCGAVRQADENAAGAVLSRDTDHEIGRWDSHHDVRTVLEARTVQRMKLSIQEPSCARASTGSELPETP